MQDIINKLLLICMKLRSYHMIHMIIYRKVLDINYFLLFNSYRRPFSINRAILLKYFL